MQTQLRQAVVVSPLYSGPHPLLQGRKGSRPAHPVVAPDVAFWVCWPEYPSSGRRTSAT